MAGPPGFEPGITNSAGWCLIQARLRPRSSGALVQLKESSLLTSDVVLIFDDFKRNDPLEHQSSWDAKIMDSLNVLD